MIIRIFPRDFKRCEVIKSEDICCRNTLHTKVVLSFPEISSMLFILLVTGDWIDIAEKRPTSQSSTQTHYLASHAVDGNSETCSRTRHLVKQMWRVDLETRVWVVSVKILTRRRLSNVDIRIGKAQDNSERISMYKPVM